MENKEYTLQHKVTLTILLVMCHANLEVICSRDFVR